MSKEDGVLHLPINRHWLEMISTGLKTEEYREIKPYWTKRLMADGKFKKYTSVKFHNYGKDLPVYANVANIRIGNGKPEWGAPDKNVYIVELSSAYTDYCTNKRDIT